MATFLLNIFLNWLFIHGTGMGLMGSALATGGSRVVNMVLLAAYIRYSKEWQAVVGPFDGEGDSQSDGESEIVSVPSDSDIGGGESGGVGVPSDRDIGGGAGGSSGGGGGLVASSGGGGGGGRGKSMTLGEAFNDAGITKSMVGRMTLLEGPDTIIIIVIMVISPNTIPLDTVIRPLVLPRSSIC